MEQAQIDRGDFLPDQIAALNPPPADEPKVDDKVEEPKDEEVDELKADEDSKDEPKEEDDEVHPKDPKTGKFEPKIPKSRFDEQVGKERAAREAAEAKAAALEAKLAERETAKAEEAKTSEIEAMESTIAELEKKHAQLLLDGEADKAAETMREIRMTERKIARIEARADAKAETSQILEAERFELAVAKLEADHPVLNPKSETFDQDLVEMILDRQRSLVAKGVAPSRALTEAAEKIMEREARLRTAESKDESEEKGLSKAQEDRKAAQVKKNLETAKAQPPSTKEVGLDSDKTGEKALPNITQMTAEEFAALPAATRAKLRGDLV